MGNTHVKPHPRTRNKKQVHWKAADRPSPPGKPQVISEIEATPDLITIRWGRPTSDGGSPISGYLVEHRRTGSPHWVRATPLLVPFPELTIGGLEPGWRYQFRVSAENAVGISDTSELSEPITVTLQRSAVTAPRFTQELEDTVALENEKSEFVVHLLGQPAPKVCWFKDGFEIFSSRRIRILTEHDKSVLTIHQTALSDEGEIKCTATNRAGHIATKARLTLEAPPSIRLPRQYEEGLLFEIGEMIRLKVSVAGRPTPLIFWSHDGETIQNDDRYEVEYNDKSSILKVGEAKRTDRGEYQIKAVNKLGEDVAAFLVTVTDKPSPPGKARVVMTLGRSVTLSWKKPSDDGGCKIGNYIIEYYRLGWNVWLKAATSRQLTTMLGDLIEGSEYKFRIKAESPYGVSDPSEESETIFIPDPKRGIIQPERGRSQTRDIADGSVPVAAKRKNKQRSQSSSRAEEKSRQHKMNANIINAEIPKRPDRNKIKSPPKTPELSSKANRKNMDKSQINKAIFDRSSMAQELAYGSPEIKLMKELDIPPNSWSSSSDRSKSPSPVESEKSVVKNLKTITSSPDRPNSANDVPESRSPSPSSQKSKVPRENNDNFTGSSEFMLVLYPDENKDRVSTSEFTFEFEENSIPPPMSLSAPELSMEPPLLLYNLKSSASSTELLHERAMMRFYQAAEAEEMELEKRRKANEARKITSDIPKIQINSQDNQDIVGLERSHSLRRRFSAGGLSQQQAALWAQRRQSLRNPADGHDLSIGRLHKYPSTAEEKRELMKSRQRSESEEKEEEEFCRVRDRMTVQGQSSFEKRKINIADEDNWNEEYEESLSEEETESSEDDDKFKAEMPPRNLYDDDEEEETYHPGMSESTIKKNIDNKPFEILTVRKNLPDPNFVPKPILKKTDYEEVFPEKSNELIVVQDNIRFRSHSPIPKGFFNRERSQSIKEQQTNLLSNRPSSKELLTDDGKKSPTSISELFSTPTQKAQVEKDLSEPHNTSKNQEPARAPMGIFSNLYSISAVAQITGITAASIVIPHRLLEKQKDAEEAKVVIDHYGDIVKSYGQRKKSTPQLHFDRDTLKQIAENEATPPIENKNLESVNTPAPIIKENENSPSRRDSIIKQNSVVPKPEYSLTPKDRTDNITKDIRLESKRPNSPIPRDRTENITKEIRLESKRENSPIPRDITNKERKSRFSPQNRSKRTPPRSPSRRSPIRGIRPITKSPARAENWSSLRTNLDQPRKPLSPSFGRREIVQRRSKSPSPIPPAKSRTNLDQPRKPSSPSSARREIMQRRSKSPSPIPPDKCRTNVDQPRKPSSPSPDRHEIMQRRSKSPSPIPAAKRRPMLREIMTQTSVGLESFSSNSYSRTSTPEDSQRQEELMAKAKVKVRGVVEYIIDLAMFGVACWLYLFDNELLAIPILFIMVYRQLKDEISKRIPNWILRRLKRKKK